jgi:hypothetical protein
MPTTSAGNAAGAAELAAWGRGSLWITDPVAGTGSAQAAGIVGATCHNPASEQRPRPCAFG